MALVCLGAQISSYFSACFWGSKSTYLRCFTHLAHTFFSHFFCTDYYPVYKDKIPQGKHIIGKYYTQRIERMNLTLRTRLKRLNRKTIGFSKSPEMHDKVIGTFIEREFYG